MGEPTRSSPVPPEARGLNPPKESRKGPYVNGALPPMSSIEDIFDDLAKTAKIKNLSSVVEALAGRPLRVATVCSGTESPILAFEMFSKSWARIEPENRFSVSQLFSCEIDPVKQSFIERNFSPKLLFRDLTTLGGNDAETAYGSRQKIPRGVDLLIAGTSCVDFSNLNNKKEDQKNNGESAATFNGLLEHVNNHRPRIVVCENVKGAEWNKHAKLWEEIGYVSEHTIVDSKNYYMPQTRERGYSISIDMKYAESLPGKESATKMVSKGIRLIKGFKRQCSSPASSFLVNALDLASQRMDTDNATKAGVQERKEISWEKYKDRHERTRATELLGDKRPISQSQPDDVSSCKFPAWYDRNWIAFQPERVIETIDIKQLKALYTGRDYDSRYKERYIDLSQGVDRGSEGPDTNGVANCITPCGILFSTDMGRQIGGLNCLVLQGLPVDRIILAGEKERDLQNLAGNAMTTTVVAAVMLSALIAGSELLRPHPGLEDDEIRWEIDRQVPTLNEAGHSLIPCASEQISHSEDLESLVLEQAAGSSRHCYCEKQTLIVSQIEACKKCGDTACHTCSGNPKHSLGPMVFEQPRMPPPEFVKLLKKTLPKRYTLNNLPTDSFLPRKVIQNNELFKEISNDYYGLVMHANGSKFFFSHITREEIWTIVYESKQFSLHVKLENGKASWLLYGKAPKHAPRNSVLRAVFERPIAKLIPTNEKSIWPTSDDAWKVVEPISEGFQIKITDVGTQLVDSFGERCGMLKPSFALLKASAELNIEVSTGDAEKLECDLSGTYHFLPDCGTSMGGLYKREAFGDQPAMYFFHDPGKLSHPKVDSYVFSLEHRRIEGCGKRETIAEVDFAWKAEKEEEERSPFETVFAWARYTETKPPLRPENIAPQFLTHSPSHDPHFPLCLEAIKDDDISLMVLNPEFNMAVSHDDCRRSYVAFIQASIEERFVEWPQAKYPHPTRLEPNEIKGVIEKVIWPHLEDLIGFHEWRRLDLSGFHEWQSLDPQPTLTSPDNVCQTCAPPPPSFIWKKDPNPKSKNLTPCENPQEASNWERLVKQRPAPFTVVVCDVPDNELFVNDTEPEPLKKVTISISAQVMFHQACGNLSDTKMPPGVRGEYRVLMDVEDLGRQPHPRFMIPNCDDEQPAALDRYLEQELRRDQAKTVSWMCEQEADDIPAFIEEEVVECHPPTLTMRYEVKASAPKTIRGGLLAGEVGYGKTACVLALFAKNWQGDTDRVETSGGNGTLTEDGRIRAPGTLVIVPTLIVNQWAGEVRKFLGDAFKVVKITNIKSLQKITLKDLLDAHIIIAANSILGNSDYYEKLAKFTGCAMPPNGARGRAYEHWLKEAVFALKETLSTGIGSGIEAWMKDAIERHAEMERFKADTTYTPSRRLRGAKFLEHARGMAEVEEQPEAEPTPESADENVHDSDSESATVISVHDSDSESARVTSDGPENHTDKCPCCKQDLPEGGLDFPEEVMPFVVGVIHSITETHSKTAQASKGKATRNGKASNARLTKTTKVSNARVTKTTKVSNARVTKTTKVSNSRVNKPSKASKGKATKNGKAKSSAESKIQPSVTKDSLKAEFMGSNPKSDFMLLTAGLLHAFHFTRVVIDEYTYLDQEVQIACHELAARSKWILSGTPNLREFSDVKTVAGFLGAHLGVDNDGDIPTQNARLKWKRSQLTAAEKFRLKQPLMSNDWYQNRHEHAQRFLNRFSRQDIGQFQTIELNEYPYFCAHTGRDKEVYDHLYRELTKQNGGCSAIVNDDDDLALMDANNILEVTTMGPPEALTRACVGFGVQQKIFTKAELDKTKTARNSRRGEVEKILLDLRYATHVSTSNHDGGKGYDKAYQDCLNSITDTEIQEELKNLNNKVKGLAEPWRDSDKAQNLQVEFDKRVARASEQVLSAMRTTGQRAQSQARAEPGERVDEEKRIETATYRVFRGDLKIAMASYLSSQRRVRKYESAILMQEKKTDFKCHNCDETVLGSSLTLLQTCGHMLCTECMNINKDKCIINDCRASLQNQIPGEIFDIESRAKKPGKLQSLVSLLMSITESGKAEDRVVIFIQYREVMNYVEKILKLNGFSFGVAKATNHEKVIEDFTRDAKEGYLHEMPILILQLGSEMAAGLNLQCAANAIFLSPLISATRDEYKSGMKQAIGRIRRFGQRSEHVYVWHLFTEDSVEPAILNRFRGDVLVRRLQREFVEADDVQSTDVRLAKIEEPFLIAQPQD